VWQKNNGGVLPEAIIMYRDGVSEGQFKIMLDHEFAAIKKVGVAARFGGPPFSVRAF
jgi:eukaryotic translation initiation factor 2C